ncbi:MAG: hypothetical protein U9Q67_00235, partial [Patescibacteria group bacterium]|nr:hypothetical protein [Patescibacteria group bacterium]
DSKNYVSNYDISGCDEDDYDDDYYYSYYEYPSENVCSLFEMTYGSKITSKQITDLTKEVGKGSWFESNSKMYLAKHYSSYLSYEDMTSDVLFEDQKNKKGLNDGTMTIVDWLKLPFTAVIYAPRNTLTSLFSNSSYYYGGSGIIVAIAIVLGLCFWSVVASVFWYFILTKTRRKFLRVLCYILQFPALWFLGLSVGVGLGVLCGLISTLVGIQIGATVVNSMIFGLQVSVLIPVLFYRFQWRRGQHKKGLAKVKKNEK